MLMLTLDCGRQVWLDAFDYSRTYGGLREGSPNPDMNRRIIEMVAGEHALVRRLYDRLGLGGRTAIEFFPAGHTIHGLGTFGLLLRHLNRPRR